MSAPGDESSLTTGAIVGDHLYEPNRWFSPLRSPRVKLFEDKAQGSIIGVVATEGIDQCNGWVTRVEPITDPSVVEDLHRALRSAKARSDKKSAEKHMLQRTLRKTGAERDGFKRIVVDYEKNFEYFPRKRRDGDNGARFFSDVEPQ